MQVPNSTASNFKRWGSAQACERVVEGINSSQSVIEMVCPDSEKEDSLFLDMIRSLWGSDKQTERNFVALCLNQLAQFVARPHKFSVTLFESDEVKYEMRRDGDDIYITRACCHNEFLWSEFSYVAYPKPEEILCTLPAQKLLDVAQNILEGCDAEIVDDAISSMVKKNNLPLRIYQEGAQYLDVTNPGYMKSGRFYVWQQNRDALKNSDSQPDFPFVYDGGDINWIPLERFFFNGEIPDSDLGKVLLLCKCHQLALSGLFDYKTKCGYMQLILDHIEHLSLSPLHFISDLPFLENFESLLTFVTGRFKGNAVSFDDLTVDSKVICAIGTLITSNPNVMRLAMKDCVLSEYTFFMFCMALKRSKALTELHLDGCMQDVNGPHMLMAYLKCSSIKVLSIKNDRIDDDTARCFVKKTAITSLNFEGNKVLWKGHDQKSLLNALACNRHLISFQIEESRWASDEMYKECQGYMRRNFFLSSHSHRNFLGFIEANLQKKLPGGDLPTDVAGHILSILIELIRTAINKD